MTPEQLKQVIEALEQGNWRLLCLLGVFVLASIVATLLQLWIAKRIEASVANKQHFSRLRYEREMAVYQKVWKAVTSLKDATLTLRPPMSPPTKPEEKKQCWDDFKGAFDNLWKVVDANRPFYPEEIWKEFRELLQICKAEGWDFQGGGEGEQWSEWYGRSIARTEQITNKLESLAEVIRNRLGRFD